MAIDLSSLDEEYREAKVTRGDQVPDGVYQVKVLTVRLTAAKTTGAPMIAWELEILGPSHAGRLIFKNSVISSASLPLVKKELEAAGLVLDALSTLPKRIHELLDQVLEVKKKADRNDAERFSVWINKRIDVADEIDVQPEIPF